jgi:hypothetical protein
VKVLFHVGLSKTGTTSLQEALRPWPNLGARPFSRPGGEEANRLHLRMMRAGLEDGELARHLRASAVDPDLPVIYSQEGCIAMPNRHWFHGFVQPAVAASRLAEAGVDGRILLTLRAPRPWLRSTYRYSVHHGYDHGYGTWLARVEADVDAGRGPVAWTTVADAYDERFGRENVALAWLDDLIADHAGTWAAIAGRVGLPELAAVGAAPLPRRNDARVGPPFVELPLNRWVLASEVRPPRGLRQVRRPTYRRWVGHRLFRTSSDRYFTDRTAEAEDRLLARLEAMADDLRRRYVSAPVP